MTEDLRTGLAKLLDGYDARRKDELARVQKGKDDDAHFLSQFTALRRDVVRPVFEAAGAIMAERGHRFSISELDYSADKAGKVTEAGISLHVVPSGMGPPVQVEDHAWTMSVTTRAYNKTVWINAGAAMNVGGFSGSKGAHPLEKVDRVLLEQELLRFVGGIVSA